MNTFNVILSLAVCIGVAVSSPCTDQCNGVCSVAKSNCDLTVVLGPVCGISYGMCTQGCTAVCGCVDGCQSQCAPSLATCNENAHNIISKGQCVIENDVCNADCQSLCAVQQAGTAVNGLIAQLAGGAAAR